jgi:hypothetical protein
MDVTTDREAPAVVSVYVAEDQDVQIHCLIDVIADVQWNGPQAGVVVRERETRDPYAGDERRKRYGAQKRVPQ